MFQLNNFTPKRYICQIIQNFSSHKTYGESTVVYVCWQLMEQQYLFFSPQDVPWAGGGERYIEAARKKIYKGRVRGCVEAVKWVGGGGRGGSNSEASTTKISSIHKFGWWAGGGGGGAFASSLQHTEHRGLGNSTSANKKEFYKTFRLIKWRMETCRVFAILISNLCWEEVIKIPNGYGHVFGAVSEINFLTLSLFEKK
jgi:hypothetical protein